MIYKKVFRVSSPILPAGLLGFTIVVGAEMFSGHVQLGALRGTSAGILWSAKETNSLQDATFDVVLAEFSFVERRHAEDDSLELVVWHFKRAEKASSSFITFHFGDGKPIRYNLVKREALVLNNQPYAATLNR